MIEAAGRSSGVDVFTHAVHDTTEIERVINTFAAEPNGGLIPVASALGLSAGQTVTVDSGANQETAVIASVRGGRGGGQAAITLATPLKSGHAATAQLSGTGITLAAPLSKPHDSGAAIGGDPPTPGAPNKYYRSRQ